jgi:hypothetical protein
MKISTPNYLKLSGIVLTSATLFFSCGASREEKAYQENTLADSVSTTVNALSKTQQAVKGDSERVFIRNADLYFKVKDVQTATFDIERIVNEHNGYTTSSVLESTVNYKNSVRVSEDSVQDVINYTVHNNMVLRIPNSELDKTLNEIAVHIDFLDHRTVKAEDVTRDLLSAKLSGNRFTHHKQRLEKVIDEKGKKLNQTVDAENELLTKQQIADDTKLNTIEIAHDVSFSTVTISMYQRDSSKKETYAYSLPLQPYEPNYGQKVLSTLSSSTGVFGDIILFILKLWPIAILILGIVLVVKIVLKQKWFA